MTTVKEFNHEIWETLELLKTAKQLYLSDELYRKIAIKLNNLQPPRPTCDKCKSYASEYSSFGVCLKEVSEYDSPPEYAGDHLVSCSFSCIHHSDYEVINDD